MLLNTAAGLHEPDRVVPQSQSIDNRRASRRSELQNCARETASLARPRFAAPHFNRAPLFTHAYGACVFPNQCPRFCPSYFEGLSNSKESMTSFFAAADFSGLADASGRVEEEAEEAIEVVQ